MRYPRPVVVILLFAFAVPVYAQSDFFSSTNSPDRVRTALPGPFGLHPNVPSSVSALQTKWILSPKLGGSGSKVVPTQTSPMKAPIFQVASVSNSGGQSAEALVPGDVNGDGYIDIVVANLCAPGSSDCNGAVSVLLGKSDGTFRPAVSYSSGGNLAYSVVLADVNGDGKLDLVAVSGCETGGSSCENGTMGVVGVLLGNGDGTFQSPLTFGSGGFDATSIAVRDIDGDGKLDVVVTNDCADQSCQNGSVGVLLGNGDGTFKTEQTYSSGGYHADSVEVGDVNGDGKFDLVVVNQCANSGFGCLGTIGVMLGNGDGTFQVASVYATGGIAAYSIAISDVNRDAKPDLLVADLCPNTNVCANGEISVLLGNGDGTFQSALTYNSGGQNPSSLTVADLDGNGDLDLVVANQCAIGDNVCDGGAVSVLFGNGDGSFQGAMTYSSGGVNALSVGVADLNRDGKPDLLVTNQCNSNSDCSGTVGVLPSSGNGIFQGAPIYNPGGQGVSALAVEDVNGDGNPDLVTALQCPVNLGCATGSGVGVLLGNGDGTFQGAVAYGSGGSNARAVAAEDVNGDGKPDLVVANQCVSDSDCHGVLGVLLGNGDGTFQAAMTYGSGGNYAAALAIADVNGDGKPDLVVANQCESNACTDASVGILLGNGDGTFQNAITQSTGGYYATSVVVADVNGDGKPDLLVANECGIDSNCASSGGIGVLLGNGDGTFQAAVTYAAGGQFPYSAAIGDVNGDGKTDLLVVNQCADYLCANGSVGVLLGNGDGTFHSAPSTLISADSFSPILLADFDDDGNLDVALGAGVLLLGNGDGGFKDSIPLHTFGSDMAVGDFNRDGRPDLAVGSVVVLLNINTVGLKTTTSLSSSLPQSSFGQTVTFTARVKPLSYTPTGTITFRDGESLLGVLALTNRHAILSTSMLAAGTHLITASYSGDNHYQANISKTVNQVVNAVTTVTILASSAEPVVLNQAVTYTATVISSDGGGATGTVTFKDRNKTIGRVTLGHNQSSYTVSYNTAGVHSITALYSGDINNSPSMSSTLKEFAESHPVLSKTMITTSGSPSLKGSTVSFKAAITSPYGPIPDGGMVTFYDSANAIGRGVTVDGFATFSTAVLSAKTHTIKASYSGDATLRPSFGKVQQKVIDYSPAKVTSVLGTSGVLALR